MPMADQQRRPLSLNGLTDTATTAASITCRTCGCLNFSTDDECERCRSARREREDGSTAGPAPVVRHPFVPTASQSVASGRAPASTTSASTPHVVSPDAKDTGSRRRDGKTRVVSAQGSLSKPSVNDRMSDASSLTGRDPARRVDTAVTTRSTTDIRPGASLLRHAPPTATPVTATSSAPVAKPISTGLTSVSKEIRPGPPVLPTTQPPAKATVATSSSNTPAPTPPTSTEPTRPSSSAGSPAPESTGGGKRPRAAPSATASSVVIDLISSDEESEHHQLRVAKRARQNARRQESIARLALRHPDPESEAEVTLLPELFQSRQFDSVVFSEADFPTQEQVTHAMRERVLGSAAPSVTSSAVSTPRSTPSSVPSSTSVLFSSAPTSLATSAMATSAATGAASTTSTTTPTIASVLVPPAVELPNTAAGLCANEEQSASVQDASKVTEDLPRVPAVTSASENGGVPPDEADRITPPEPIVQKHRASNPPGLIVLDDSDDEGGEEEADAQEALFQSRRFDSIVFSARDFLNANDGLNLARRSSTVTRQPSPSSEGPRGGPMRLPNTPNEAGPTSAVLSIHSDAPPVSTTATSSQIPAGTPLMNPTIPTPTVLEPRRKVPSHTAPVEASKPVVAEQASIKIEESLPRPATMEIIKPSLGQVSTDFIQFMRNSDDDDDDVDDEELARAKLLEVVDLTNLTDDSGDEDEDDDDYFEIIETYSSELRGDESSASTSVPTVAVLPNSDQGISTDVGANTHPPNNFPVIKRTRAPRPKETCALCEEKAWIKALVNCPDCKKYYHKRCAREYGDENKCWACDLDGMIDDSELTEDHKNEVITMFGAFRQSSDSEQGDDVNEDADEELEEKAETPNVANQAPLVLNITSTKSTRRWKEFFDVSTASVEESFHAVTDSITKELQDQEAKSKYSKGFAKKEDLENGIAEVIDHYADLQDREERLQRARAPTPETAVGAAADANNAGSSSVDAPTQPPTDPMPEGLSSQSNDPTPG